MEHVTPEQLVRLQSAWVQLLSTFAVEPVDAYPIFDRLVAAYGEPYRHYHTLEHLAEMFRVVAKLADATENLPHVQLAVWFHDAVYDSKAKDNEARSAEFMRQSLSPQGIPPATLDAVAALILATAHGDLLNVDADTAVLLDADLAILSAEERRYARYETDVRLEYAWVDDEAYHAGRSHVLQAFLNRPRIYQTERMHAAAEEAARTNLLAEIARLTQDASRFPKP